MTKEQQEAVNRLKNLVDLRKNVRNEIKYDTCICATKDLDTILGVLGADKCVKRTRDKKYIETERTRTKSPRVYKNAKS